MLKPIGLPQELRSEALMRFAQRMQARGRAAANMSKAGGKTGTAIAPAQSQAVLPQSQGRAVADPSHTFTGLNLSHSISSVGRSHAQPADTSLVQEPVQELEPAQVSGKLLLHSLDLQMVC